MQKALEIYERSYGTEDVRTCKIKRNVALVYLRGNKFEDALRELKEVETLENILYGETSPQKAKTQKIIGESRLEEENPPMEEVDNMSRPKEMAEEPGAFLHTTHRAHISGQQEDFPIIRKSKDAFGSGWWAVDVPPTWGPHGERLLPLRRYVFEIGQWEMQCQFRMSAGLLSW